MRPGPGEPRPSLSEDTENLRPLDWARSISQACIGSQSLLIGQQEVVLTSDRSEDELIQRDYI